VCLPTLTYNEAWELSYFGANVLHPRTTLPAMRYKIPIAIRNFFNLDAPGRWCSSLLAHKRGVGRRGPPPAPVTLYASCKNNFDDKPSLACAQTVSFQSRKFAAKPCSVTASEQWCSTSAA
jgi:aspartokinase